MSLSAYPMLILALTGSPRAAGLVAFFATLPQIVHQMLAGHIGDAFDRRRTLFVCDVGRFTTGGLTACLAFLGISNVAAYCVLAFSAGVMTTQFVASEQGLIRDVVPVDQMSQAFGLNQVRTNFAAIIGRWAGAATFGLGRAVPFLIDALTFLISAAFIRGIPSGRTTLTEKAGDSRAPAKTNAIGSMRGGWVWFWSHNYVRDINLIGSAGNFFYAGISLITVLAGRDLGWSALILGLTLAWLPAGAAIGSLLAPLLARRFTVGCATVLSSAGYLIGAVLIMLGQTPWTFWLAFLIVGVCSSLYNVAPAAYEATLIPAPMQGRVLAVARLISYGVQPVAPLLVGYLAHLSSSFRWSAMPLVVAAILAMLGTCRRHIRAAKSC